MADALTIIGDLVRRVQRLERMRGPGIPSGASRARKTGHAPHATEPESAAILRYLAVSPQREAEDEEIRAIRDYLMTSKEGTVHEQR